ncbi:hypothetical protein GCM10023187_20960 [Nibrella viscosa]|uniref:HTH araC/xylS-type domain-containing protein n=1 Tax=Nibrella viscosa TaxID=1084524 RepID=A0ABP8KE08_9BACT
MVREPGVKEIGTDIGRITLNTDLYKLHKTGEGHSEFGMDKTAELLDGGFGLYSTTDVRKNIGPVKTQYYRISLTRQDSARFDIGLETYQPYRNCILFGIPGQVFSFYDVSEDFLAYYMLFGEQFISHSLLKAGQQEYFPFLTYAGLQCFELNTDTASEIEAIIFKINDEVSKRQFMCHDVICLYIQLILIHANRHYGAILRTGQATSNSLQHLYTSYLKLVSRQFLTVRRVADYADMLHVSPDYLNRAIKSCSDKTAHELINNMMLMEAKAYLLYADLSIAEIAYKLDFADPSHFNRFFRNLPRWSLESSRKYPIHGRIRSMSLSAAIMNFGCLINHTTAMTTEQNKVLVRWINKEFIEGGNLQTFNEIFAEDFVNYTAPPGSPQNRDGVVYFFNHLLKPAFPDLTVEIHEMIAEGDKVITRKSFHATHKGEFFGVQPTHKEVVMDVIDIIQLRDGKYIGHWGILDVHRLLAQLSAQ